MEQPSSVVQANPSDYSSINQSVSRFGIKVPSFNIIRDFVKVSDAAMLLAASTVERIPTVQDALIATFDENHLLANIVGGCVTYSLIGNNHGYNLGILKNIGRQAKRLILPLLAGSIAVYTSLLVMHHDQTESFTGSLRWTLLSVTFMAGSRLAYTPIISRLARSGKLAKRVAIVGVNFISQGFIDKASSNKDSCKVVGLYTDHPTSQTMQSDVKVLGPVSQIFPDSQIEQFDSVVLCLTRQKEFTDLVKTVSPVIADIQVVGQNLGNYRKEHFTYVGGNMVATVLPKPLNDRQRVQKYLFDVVFGSIAFVALAPLMLFTAIAIRIDSPGKILFHQPRTGYNNKLFTTYKFRSMYANDTDILANTQTTKGDPRITRVGRIIRKFSIDELPQLINVINGDMSLVGPRPHAPGTKSEGKLFPDIVEDYVLRHKVKPGITGWAQINGYRGDTPRVELVKGRVEYDLFYIQNWSIRFDIKIICLTVLREIISKKAF